VALATWAVHSLRISIDPSYPTSISSMPASELMSRRRQYSSTARFLLRLTFNDEHSFRELIIGKKCTIVFWLIDPLRATAQAKVINALAELRGASGLPVHFVQVGLASRRIQLPNALILSRHPVPKSSLLMQAPPRTACSQTATYSSMKSRKSSVLEQTICNLLSSTSGVALACLAKHTPGHRNQQYCYRHRRGLWRSELHLCAVHRLYVYETFIELAVFHSVFPLTALLGPDGEVDGFGNRISIQTAAIAKAAKALRRVYRVDKDQPVRDSRGKEKGDQRHMCADLACH
jgi:hypothetical protein